MIPRRLLSVMCLAVWCSCMAQAQQSLPRIAVIPLNPVSVSMSDATTFSGLLETALVKTEAFDLLEQSQVSLILQAQERSMADCTDEKCAIEFGKLLSAEQIVLGSISLVGGKLIINAKIIDVTTGKTLRADTVEAPTISALTGEVELLAYKLAGLTVRTGGQEQVAQAFGELFVETDPEGAEVSLNGMPKGRSPVVIDRVPIGRVTVEARKEALYASRDVEVSGEALVKLKLELSISLGNLFIRSSVNEGIRVLLDGRDIGPLGAGLFEDLPAGEHAVELTGTGYLWQGNAVVQTEKTVTVEAYPREVGAVRYSVPADAQAEITARDYRMVVRASGTLENVPVGSYSVRVGGTDYETLDLSITVARAHAVSLSPALKRTEAYEKRAAYEELSAAVQEVAALAASRRAVTQRDVQRAQQVARQVSEASWSFPDLKAEIAELVPALERRVEIDGLTARRDELEVRLAWARKKRRGLLIGGGVSLGVGVAGTAAAVISYLLGPQAYAAYEAATLSAEAQEAWSRVALYGGLLNGGIASGAGGLGLGVALILAAPRTGALEQELAEVGRKLEGLEGEGR